VTVDGVLIDRDTGKELECLGTQKPDGIALNGRHFNLTEMTQALIDEITDIAEAGARADPAIARVAQIPAKFDVYEMHPPPE
jgi:hypothetical protein